MNELKACPFCGGEAKYIPIIINGVNLVLSEGYVKCENCGCSTDKVKMYPEAIKDWNRRPAPENKPLTLEQLRQMDGEPVWIDGKDYGGWTIFKASANKQVARCPDNVNLSYYMDGYGKTWLAYARKPEQERDAP